MSRTEVEALSMLGIMGLIPKLIRDKAHLMTDEEEGFLQEIELTQKVALEQYPKVRLGSKEFRQIEKNIKNLEAVKQISLIVLVSVCLAGFSDISDYVRGKRKVVINDCLDVLSRFGLKFDPDKNEFAEYDKALKILNMRSL